MKTEFNERIEDWFADAIGKCFSFSAEDNYDSDVFVKEFVNSEYGRSILNERYIKPYENERYMYSKAIEELNLKKGKPYDKYVLWMYGYLLKYWVTYYDDSPSAVYNILPIKTFNKLFGKYHTQGWKYIIEDAKKAR